MPKKTQKKKPELFSLHPLTVEEAITKALKADPKKVREKLDGERKKN